MPITAQQLRLAQADQQNAARDERPQVRLIAGPGTGKSFAIEDRVCWLLENGANPQRVFAVSFTNASVQDLRLRITQYCQSRGQDGGQGLSARVVFIPGLEEEVFPGPRRRPYPGLVEEAARLLYVSITRARAACIMSFARRRVVHGKLTQHAPSRFNRFTGGAFAQQTDGLTPSLAARIVANSALM
jgi:superfamily I DNA/RNA helicase